MTLFVTLMCCSLSFAHSTKIDPASHTRALAALTKTTNDHDIFGYEWVPPAAVGPEFGKRFVHGDCGPWSQPSPQVLFSRYGFHMCRVDAASHPAQMIEFQSFGNGPIDRFEHRSVSIDHSVRRSYASIPILGCSACPKPTSRGWFRRNESEDSFHQGSAFSRHCSIIQERI